MTEPTHSQLHMIGQVGQAIDAAAADEGSAAEAADQIIQQEGLEGV